MSNYTLSTFSTGAPRFKSLFMDPLGNAIAGSYIGPGVTTYGLYYSSDYGHNWNVSDISSGFFQSVFMNQNNAIAGSNGKGLYYSSNYGHSWTISDISSENFNSVFMDQSNAIAGSNNGLYYSSNYGHSWTISIPGFFNSVFMDQSNAIAGARFNIGLYYSSDYGHSWTQSIPGTFQSVFMDQNNAIAGSGNGLYYSSNYGHSWTISDISSGSFNSVFMDQSNAIAGSSTGLYYSQNSGQTWIQSNQTNGNFTSVFMDQSNAIAGSDNGLYYSSNYGHTWNKTNVTTQVNAVFMNQNNRLSGGVETYYYTELVCFKEGTKILTDKGYVAIQDLKKGDLVKTVNDFIPIHAIGKREIYHPAAQNRDKDQLYKCSPEHFPVFEDLVITGCHSILVDEFKGEREKTIEINGDAYVTENKYRLPACVDERTTVYETPGTYTIYHFALENDDYYNNYGVYANGLLVESCSKRYLTELANMEII